jgi:hypothetical protein
MGSGICYTARGLRRRDATCPRRGLACPAAERQIALVFQNNLAYALAQAYVWQPTHCVGTFGEYDMNAVRNWD